MHPYLAFQSLPLSGDRTDGAECAVGAPAPLKFRCVCPGGIIACYQKPRWLKREARHASHFSSQL
ncbi:MAG: hypothetical protein WBA07_29495 [Rivularia sp. (in: cyanobacteria)]